MAGVAFFSNSTGCTYEGYFKEGRKDGSGTLHLSNGDQLKGKWRQGVIDGPVEFLFKESSPWNEPDY
jgi:hypothetical protein